MIAYPIGDPIGSYRAYPNRPRIAQYESCRVVPFTGVLKERELKTERARRLSRSLPRSIR